MSKEIGKMLSLVLRHTPERIGITLDQNGWTDIQQLITKIQPSLKFATRPKINISTDGKAKNPSNINKIFQ